MKCKNCGFEFAEGVFCPECGTRNDFNGEVDDVILENEEDEEEVADIDKAIDDVIFYYEQSRQKREAAQNAEPIYYNRAQQLLKRMVKQKVSDYRVWWEACKPIDFWEETFSEQMVENYKVNDKYFTKALDYADLEIRKELIKERDSYQERKRVAVEAINKTKAEKAAEARKQEEERKEAERIQREKAAEEQRAREQLELAKKEEAERLKQEKRVLKKMENEGKAMAGASLICGIVSVCTFGSLIVPEVLGIIFAFQGQKQGVMRGMAKAGLICSCASIVLMIVFIVLSMSL